MADTHISLTPEGYAKLKEELEWREGERAKEITEAIRKAKDFGDLSENAEYDAARDDQAQNIARISQIRAELANATVVDVVEDVSSVSLGCKVTIEEDAKDAEPVVFTIVGTTETDSLAHRISNESPMGAALMGREVGDVCEVRTPNGSIRSYTIVSIER